METAFRLAQTGGGKKLFLPAAVSLIGISIAAQLVNLRSFSLLPSVCLLFMILMGLFYMKIRSAHRVDFFLSGQIFLAGLSFIYLVVRFPDAPHNFSLLSFLILSGFVLFRLGYMAAGAIGLVLILFYAAASFLVAGVAVPVIAGNTMFLLILSSIGMIAGYMIECYTRSIFLKNMTLVQMNQLSRQAESRQTKEIDRIHKSLELEIRAHIEAEAQLRESESKYRHLVASLPEGVLIVRDHTIVFSNPTFERITGYSTQQLENLPLKMIFTDSPETGLDDSSRICEKITRIDGTQIHIEKTVVPIALHQESAHLFTITDISEKVQAEQDKKRLEKELSKARKMEALGLLAGGVAHDLNNVLSGLVSTPDMLLTDLPDDCELRPHLEMIKKSGDRAAGIVDDLLTLARGGKKGSEPVHLNYVVEDYFESPEFERVLREHAKVRIEKKLDSRVSYMNGSGLQIRKIVMNLISNAIEAVGNKNGCVRVETRWLPVHDLPKEDLPQLEGGDFLKFSVSDTGDGINREDIERIFEPFYSRKVVGRSGTGLGLSIVWNAVKDHNGYIDVKSRTGDTRFDIYLPVILDVEPEQDVVVTIDDMSGNGEKILIVEDMETQRDITLNMIRRLGYSPVAVASGEKALESVRREKFDLIVLDMILDQGMNGFETYRQLLSIDPDLKAVVTSGYAVTSEVTRSQDLGAGDFVKKPFTLEQIGLAIKKELNAQREKR